MTTTTLQSLIIKASEALDAAHQGDQWPNPVEWDGRPLDDQARDLCALLDVAAEAARDRGDDDAAAALDGMSEKVWKAAEAQV